MDTTEIFQFTKVTKLLSSDIIKKTLEGSLSRKINPSSVFFFYEVFYTLNEYYPPLEYIERSICFLASKLKYKRCLNSISFGPYKKLISSSSLRITSEIEVFNIADNWILNDPGPRSEFSKDLIKIIRLPLLSSAAIHTLSKKENSAILQCAQSKKHIENATGQAHINSRTGTHFKQAHSQNRFCSHEKFDLLLIGKAIRSHKFYEVKEAKFDQQLKLTLCDRFTGPNSSYRGYEHMKDDRVFDLKTVIPVDGEIYFLGRSYFYTYLILEKSWARFRCSNSWSIRTALLCL